MTLLTADEAPRAARLARLHLSEAEVVRLAPALEAITRDFSSLAERAGQLADPPAAALGATRADEIAPAAPEVTEGILRAAAPRVDPASRAILTTPRGSP
ncbi:MAG: hypothetical protein WDA16_00400 [Candidatus Thermoplasmatota archaeon]